MLDSCHFKCPIPVVNIKQCHENFLNFWNSDTVMLKLSTIFHFNVLGETDILYNIKKDKTLFVPHIGPMIYLNLHFLPCGRVC